MSRGLQDILDAPIIELDSIDSTNNYAMQLIDADTAQNGLTITAREQTKGRGQRGRTWNDVPGQSLLMSIVLQPRCHTEQQFAFSAAIAVAVADVLTELNEHWDIRIKWPNDIIVNDKKAGGILIENVWRGSEWSHSVVGLGMNVLQAGFPADLPQATSLKAASGREFAIPDLLKKLRERIIAYTFDSEGLRHTVDRYNVYLFRKGAAQAFADAAGEWEAVVCAATYDGRLQVQLPGGSNEYYTHGAVTWKWV